MARKLVPMPTDAPVGQHFLPRAAYLRHFSIPNYEGFVYFYRRGALPVKANISNVAKERFLYSPEQNGCRTHKIEAFFGAVDGDSVPVLEKLNANRARHLGLGQEERAILIGFTAYQLVRTPAFRDMRARQVAVAVESARTLTANELRRVLPPDIVPAEIASDAEGLEKLWREAMQDLAIQDAHLSWLRSMRLFAQRTFNELWAKPVKLLRCEDECFLTCDHPVALNYETGIRPSEVFFPVGSHTALLFDAGSRGALDIGDIELKVQRVSPSECRRFNRRIMESAEDFVYAAVNRPGIAKRFDKTPKPTRFEPASAKDILSLPAA